MPRLHLKRTPAEDEEHIRKKAKKAARREKEVRRGRRWTDDGAKPEAADNGLNDRRNPSRSASPGHKGSVEEDGEYGPFAADPGPSSSRSSTQHTEHSYDYEHLRARVEQERFDEKMRDALEDDGLLDPTQRLDGVEARLNSYAHIPRRWRGTEDGFSAGLWMEDAQEDIGLQPWQMNDDEYAEYIRAGMWRKTNHAEFQERLRKKEERKARKQRERLLREETRRLEREAEVEREQRRAARARRRVEGAKVLYEKRWAKLLERPSGGESGHHESLLLDDIPWPILPPSRREAEDDSLILEDFTMEAVSKFLLQGAPLAASTANTKGSTKDILRSTMLKYHPDKFESRVLVRVRENEKERVKEAANIVVRVLNALSKENADKSG